MNKQQRMSRFRFTAYLLQLLLAFGGTTADLESCAPEDVGKLFPHPDPNMYYECTVSGLQEMPCPDGLVFNPEKGYCDWPYNVSPGPDPDPLSCEEEQSGSSGCEVYEEYLCKMEDLLGILVPHPSRLHCDWYCRCELEARSTCHKCPGGYNFDSRRNVCEPPDDAQCLYDDENIIN